MDVHRVFYQFHKPLKYKMHVCKYKPHGFQKDKRHSQFTAGHLSFLMNNTLQTLTTLKCICYV